MIRAVAGRVPVIAAGAFIADGAIILGDVTIGPRSSIWYGCVLRGDEEPIRIGEGTNIQDGTIIHSTNGEGTVTIGADVTVGHRAVLHGCVVQDRALVGIGAVVLDGAVIEEGALVAAGAIVAPRTVVTAGTLWAGCPARMVRPVKPAELAFILGNPAHYRRQAALHARTQGT